MASAALAEGLKSIAYSSSDDEDDTRGLPGGGITFGSVEPSFRSEDYDRQRPTNGYRRPPSRAIPDDEDQEDLTSVQPPPTMRKASEASRVTSTSTRPPPTSITTPSPLQPHEDAAGLVTQGHGHNKPFGHSPTGILDLSVAQSTSVGDDGTSAHALRDLNLDDPSFVSPPSSPAAKRRSWEDAKRGAAGGATKTGKGRQSDGGSRGQLTLREQEKVRSDPFYFHLYRVRAKVLRYEIRRSILPVRRTSLSSSRSIFSKSALPNSHLIRSTLR
jgi:hypothetical protein